MLDRQSSFNRAVAGILGQGALAKNEYGACYYRFDPVTEAHEANAPLRCAIGWLIPDDMYDPNFEKRVPHLGVGSITDITLARTVGAETPNDATFLRDFQREVHDAAETLDDFRILARTFATRHNLSTEVLDNA